ALNAAGFPTEMPAYLPAGYRPAAARLIRTDAGTSVTVVFRRPTAELGGVGLIFTQGLGQTLPPPTERGALAVRVGQVVGRWSPDEHLLEWTVGPTYHSLSSPTFDLSTILRVATSMRAMTGQEGA